MTIISGGKENLRADFIRENFKGHHSTYTISKSLRRDPSYRNSLGLERTAQEFPSFHPVSDATLKGDPREQRPSTCRTALGWTRALSFGVSAGACAHRKPRKAWRRRRSPGLLETPHRDFWGTRGRCAGPDPVPAVLPASAVSPSGAVRSLPAAARLPHAPIYLGAPMYFLFAYFSRKCLAKSQGQPVLRSFVRFPRDPRSRQTPATPRPPKAQPLLCRAPLDGTSAARTSSRARGSLRSSGQAWDPSSEGAGLAKSPQKPGWGPGGDSGGCRAGRVGMPGCLDTVITNHRDNPHLPGISSCRDGCKGQRTCSQECQSSFSSLTFTQEGERRGTRKGCSTCAQKHSRILWETLPESCHAPGLRVCGYSREETYTQLRVSSQVTAIKSLIK